MVLKEGVIIKELSLKEYLYENDIEVTEEYFKGYRGECIEDYACQMVVVESVHKILAGYCGNSRSRINSNIGKRIENIKVLEKRLTRDLAFRNELQDKNIMDIFLVQQGEKILKKVKYALEELNKIDYLSLIKRSMKKNEICLGRVDEGNLRVLEKIEIGSLKGISYNLVEEDIYSYLKRVKRKDCNLDFTLLIDEYVNLAHLSQDSRKYIEALLFVPYDSLRQWYRYKVNKRNLSPLEYLENLKLTMEYEMKEVENE